MRVNSRVWRRYSGMSLAVPFLITLVGLALSGCVATGLQERAITESQRSLTYGRVKVTDVGPNPRQYLSQVRFFDVVNTQTQKQTRVSVMKRKGGFAVSLDPGPYEVVRIQISEGPFMAESYMNATFEVVPDAVVYVGIWNIEVDTPRTQRMVSFDMSEDDVNWQEVFEEHSDMQGQKVVASIPHLLEKESRLYAVAPNPKVKYFYRR